MQPEDGAASNCGSLGALPAQDGQYYLECNAGVSKVFQPGAALMTS